jgi:hypothetical protein
MPKDKYYGRRTQSVATASSSTSTPSTMPTVTVHQPRQVTLFCWIHDESDRSFPVDIGDDRTIGHLKDAIVKKKPLSFQDVEPDELDLWKVSAFPPCSTYADNFPTRHPFRSTGNSRTMLAINSFLKMMCYWRETCWRKSFRCQNLQRRCFTSLYDVVLVSHLFDTSLLVTYR